MLVDSSVDVQYKIGADDIAPDKSDLFDSAKRLHPNMFNLRQAPQGRRFPHVKRRVPMSLIETAPLARSNPDTAAMCGIGRSTMCELIARGAGPRVTKIGRRSVILTADAEIWIRNLARSAPAAA